MITLTAALLTLASLNVKPTIQFTGDSVYKNPNILKLEVQENYNDAEELVSKDLLISVNYTLGYQIYDNPDTPYIDGLKFDDVWVTDGIIKDYDDSIEHTIYIKTVYSSDISGTFASAKDGDYSRILSNPVTIFQLFYYTVALVSIILGLFGISKSRKSKVKSSKEISDMVSKIAEDKFANYEQKVSDLFTGVITPTFNKLSDENQDIIKALILTQSGDTSAQLALIDLLKKKDLKDFVGQADLIKEAVQKTVAEKEAIKQDLKESVNQIANNVFVEEKEDGTSI
jgi:flagellar basal body-associated protein FliL